MILLVGTKNAPPPVDPPAGARANPPHADAVADGAVLVALDALGLLEDHPALDRVALLALAVGQVGQQLVELVLRRRGGGAGVGQRRLLGEGLAVPPPPGRQLRLPVALVGPELPAGAPLPQQLHRLPALLLLPP